MVRIFLKMSLCLALLGCKNVTCTEFDIDMKANVIVSKLWNALPVPSGEMQDFLMLLEEESNKENRASQEQIKEITTECKGLFEKISSYRDQAEKDHKTLANIETFINTVNNLGEGYSINTIENAFALILEKY